MLPDCVRPCPHRGIEVVGHDRPQKVLENVKAFSWSMTAELPVVPRNYNA
jgi:hypothetical protein